MGSLPLGAPINSTVYDSADLPDVRKRGLRRKGPLSNLIRTPRRPLHFLDSFAAAYL